MVFVCGRSRYPKGGHTEVGGEKGSILVLPVADLADGAEAFSLQLRADNTHV